MSRASRTVFLIFCAYWLFAAAAPDALLRVGAFVLEKAGGAVALFTWSLMSNRALAAALGAACALAALGLILRFRRGGRRPGCLCRLSQGMVLFVLYLYFYCYAAIVILYVPYMDAWYPAVAIAPLAAAAFAEKKLRAGARIRGRSAGRVLGAGAFVLAAGAVAAIVSKRPGAFGFALFLAALIAFDELVAPELRARLGLHPRAFQRPARRAIVILAMACAAGMHTFLTAQPYFCGKQCAGRNTVPVFAHGDAFDVISTDKYLFATFKDGTLARIGADDYASARTVRPANAPLQRMAHDRARGRVFVSVYKSGTPVLAVDERSMHAAPLAVQGACAATDVAYGPAADMVYYPCEPQYRVHAVNAATGRETAAAQLPRGANIYSLALDERHGLVYAAPATLDPHLYALDARTLEVKRRIRTGIANQGIALDPRTGTLYMARFFGARVAALDTAANRVVASHGAGHLVRDVTPAGRCRLLTADYAQGTARLLDVCASRALRVWRVPPRVRGVHYDERRRRAFAATGCGVYELKLPD